MKLLLLALALCGLCAPASATVIIYKGTLLRKVKPTSSLPSKLTAYLLYEPEGPRFTRLLVFQQNGEKIVQKEVLQGVNRSSVAVNDGKTATVLAFAINFENDAQNFVDIYYYLRGTNSTLTIRTSGQTQQHPRTFAATTLSSQTAAGIGYYTEQRATYGFQENRTKAANDANQTLQQAADALAAALDD
jgi:hypothetical protein